MKKILKYILGIFDLEIKRKRSKLHESPSTLFSPIRADIYSFFDFLIERNFYPTVIIDVGVADGTPELTSKFDKAYFVWMEPLQEFEPVLKKLSQQYSGQYHICAAGKTVGKFILNVHEDLAGSSIYNEVDGDYADGKKREIEMSTLDEIVKGELRNNILLKIDVQGAELDVLDGATEILAFTEVIILEVSMFKFQQHAPDFYDIVNDMKKRGFVVYDLYHGHNRPLDNALAQVDLVFVKEDGQFRKSHHWATNEQRSLIHNEKLARNKN